MAVQRCVLELGTGVDLYGNDPTKAAKRAVFDALRHGSLTFPRVFGFERGMMIVEVTIATPYHYKVDKAEVLKEIPYGQKRINVVEGGLRISSEGNACESTIMANAAIVVSLDVPE